MHIEEYVPFSTLTTFKVGGSVRFVLSIMPEECGDAVRFARERGLPLIPVGGGSNILGVDGVLEVVFVRVNDQSIAVDGTRLTVDAGAAWDAVADAAVTLGLWGIENLSAIPGTMGGAVVQNIGAYGAVLADSVVSVDVFDTETNSRTTFTKEQCAFGYRTSIFKLHPDRYIILCVTLGLSDVPSPSLSYKDLAVRFRGVTPTLADIRKAVIAIRAEKFPPLETYGTAGSFFLNPIVTAEEARVVQDTYPTMPVFPLPEGGVKVPLGWFFEHVLLLRGERDGAVEAWRAQALVLVAHNGATAAEVKKFSEKIIERAKKEIGITIKPEVRIL